VPFSTALLAHFPSLRVALIEYWLNIVLLGAMLLASLARILIAQALYLLAVLLTLVLPTWVSIALIVIIALITTGGQLINVYSNITATMCLYHVGC
jgi:hypothetical protein